MSDEDVQKIKKELEDLSAEERNAIFLWLSEREILHPFQKTLNASPLMILEALARSADITIRGVRGIIAEAAFVTRVIPTLKGWNDKTPTGEFAYDALLEDAVGEVSIQIKMQRKERGEVKVNRSGKFIVEVQRTRGGEKDGVKTRPYRFGDFDLLAVCLEPAKKDWMAFTYIPCGWLHPRSDEPSLIEIMQPVSLEDDEIWTSSFEEAVQRLRSDKPRPRPQRLPLW
jgi:hypothetical protein